MPLEPVFKKKWPKRQISEHLIKNACQGTFKWNMLGKCILVVFSVIFLGVFLGVFLVVFLVTFLVYIFQYFGRIGWNRFNLARFYKFWKYTG